MWNISPNLTHIIYSSAAVVIFIGHGNDPDSWSLMPPSATSPELTQEDLLGALVFFHDDKKSLYRPGVSGLPNSKYTLFISLACYSGNTFQKAMTGNFHFLHTILKEGDYKIECYWRLLELYCSSYKVTTLTFSLMTHFNTVVVTLVVHSGPD